MLNIFEWVRAGTRAFPPSLIKSRDGTQVSHTNFVVKMTYAASVVISDGNGMFFLMMNQCTVSARLLESTASMSCDRGHLPLSHLILSLYSHCTMAVIIISSELLIYSTSLTLTLIIPSRQIPGSQTIESREPAPYFLGHSYCGDAEAHNFQECCSICNT